MIMVLWRSWCVSFLTHTSRFRFSKHSNSEVTSLINVSGDHGYYPQKALDILQEGAIITLKVFSQEITWTFRVHSSIISSVEWLFRNVLIAIL